jgi:RNA polymerase sigma factor (sigma-70 family)
LKSTEETVIPLTDVQQRFVQQHTPLIYHVLRKHNYQSLPEETYEDLTTRLFLRLCVCATRFDPERQVKPSSYLVNCFEGEIKNFFRDEIWMIRPPRDLREGSFSAAVDQVEGEKSKAELKGENPETVRTSANPLPLDALYSDEGGEDEFFLDVVAAEDNVEATVMAREGGRQVIDLIFQALRPEERVILNLMTHEEALVRVQETFRISHEVASEAWVELQMKVQAMWWTIHEGGFPELSEGSQVIARVMRQRFVPRVTGFINIRRQIAEQQRAARAA